MTISRIQEMAKPYMDYDMIKSHTVLPEFPESRTKLLLAFLHAGGVKENNHELYALVTSLVQVALDTHELVPESRGRDEHKDTLSLQLKVLAGDYFSSRFYQLLSQSGQIDAIQQLAQSICEVNRMKMTLYLNMKQMRLAPEEYLQQAADIHMRLFLTFSHLMGSVQAKWWPDVLLAFTRCDVLLKERLRILSPAGFRDSWGYWQLLKKVTKEEQSYLTSTDMEGSKIRALLHKYDVLPKLDGLLDTQVSLLRELIRQVDDSALSEELWSLGQPYFEFSAGRPLVKEI